MTDFKDIEHCEELVKKCPKCQEAFEWWYNANSLNGNFKEPLKIIEKHEPKLYEVVVNILDSHINMQSF